MAGLWRINYETASTTRAYAAGGRSGAAAAIQTGVADSSGVGKDKYEEWADSAEEFSTLIHFNKDGLVPIHSLASNPERLEQLRSYYEDLVSKNERPEESKKIGDVSYLKTSGELSRWDDSDSDCKKSITVFRPNDKFIEGGYVWGAQVAAEGKTSEPQKPVVCFKVLDSNIFRSPELFDVIWTFPNNGKRFTCYLPKHTDQNYLPLGYLLDLGRDSNDDYKEPREEVTKGLVLVHRSLLSRQGSHNITIWNDAGSGSDGTKTISRRDFLALPANAIDPNSFVGQINGSSVHSAVALIGD